MKFEFGKSLFRISIWAFAVFALAAAGQSQQSITRILAQDPALNNLVDPPGYKTSKLGTLGNVVQKGTGKQPMILIPGLGFGADVFDEFMEARKSDFRMFAVSLAGFGGTAAPPSPGENNSFGEQTWTNAALSAIEKLIEDEHLENPIIVGHWLTGTQIALRLALKHPSKIRAVIILSGSARLAPIDPKSPQANMSLEQRVAGTDKFLAPKWFKTVTRQTWDDNNFLPGDYANNPILGLRLWRKAAEPALHVWVRYLCEFHAQDISLEMKNVSVPTLILEPGLEGLFYEPGKNYMEAFLLKSWEGSVVSNPKISLKIIPNSRVIMWADEPAAVDKAIAAFLATVR